MTNIERHYFANFEKFVSSEVQKLKDILRDNKSCESR